MSDDSEEKTLPATQRKLRKARERGQVVTSREAVMSLTGIAALLYLYAVRLPVTEKFRALWQLEPAFEGQTFEMQMQSKVAILWSLGLEVVAPLAGIVIGVGVLGGMLIAGGPLFSTEPLAPSFERINPAGGLKKIFGRRALVGFAMHVVRLALLLVVLGLVLLAGWQVLMRAPVCGLGCAMETLDALVLPIVIGAVAAMAVMAAADYLVQRTEFLREQRMTVTERKRETKDQTGDPHLRGQLKRDRRALLSDPTGPAQATLVLTAGRKVGIGLRYRQGETPAPLVVARVRGAEAIGRLERLSGAPVEDDPALVALLGPARVGGYVTGDEEIVRLAPLLQRAAFD